MHVIIDKKSFVKALGHVQSIAERKHSITILANVRIDAKANKLSLCTTDMDITMIETIDVKVEIEGSVTVPVHTLYEIVKKLPDNAKITFIHDKKVNQHSVVLASNAGKFTLPCLPVEEFPNFVGGEYDNEFILTAPALKSLIMKTKHAMSFDETRYYLNGIYLHVIEKENLNVLRAVATDTHRLAINEITLSNNSNKMPGIIIPKKTINELAKLLEESTGEIKINISDTKISFLIEKTNIISKLIDGKFPDYNKVIPEDNDKILESNVENLINAIDLVTTISVDKTKAVKFNIMLSKIILSAGGEINGTASALQEIPASYNETSISIAFNSKYLLDILSCITGDNVQFKIASSSKAVMVLNPGNSSAVFVIMPMQV